MYPAIHVYDDQAFDDKNEENEKKINECFIVKKPLRHVPSQGIVEQAKQNGELSPQQADRWLTQGLTKYDPLIKAN